MIKDMPVLVFFGSMLDAFVKICLILILLGKHNFYKEKKFILSVFVLGIYLSFSYMITDNSLRTILFFVISFLLSTFIMKSEKRGLFKIFMTTFTVWVAMALMDVLSYIIISGIFKIDMSSYRNNISLVYANNSIILFLLVFIFYIKPIRRITKNLTDIKLTSSKSTIFVILFSVTIFSIIFYLCIFKFPVMIILIASFVMVIVYTIITLVSINVTSQKNKMKLEYDVVLTNLSEYENLLIRQRILNHENKNQLLVVRGMIIKNENAVEYIDSLVENQYKDNDTLIMRTNLIPSGGLRGLIYYKMLTMKDKKINVGLEVNPNISDIDFSKISTNTNQGFCKIVGVFLDNAIQEVNNLDTKSINIIVETIDNSLIIKISNNYGCNSISNIGEKGYTTKGAGHGYGLRLVKSIIENNDCFEHKTEINGKVFSQIVKLRLKK